MNDYQDHGEEYDDHPEDPEFEARYTSVKQNHDKAELASLDWNCLNHLRQYVSDHGLEMLEYLSVKKWNEFMRWIEEEYHRQ